MILRGDYNNHATCTVGLIFITLIPMRFVLDTNVLIDGIQDDFSAQARLLEAVRSGRVEAVATPAIVREYNLLVRRRIHDPAYKKSIQGFIAAITPVDAAAVENVVIDDEEDKKFLAAAKGGEADAIVTSDKHLLDIGELGTTRIITPAEAWRQVDEEAGGNSAWQNFVKGLGIGGRDL